MRAIKYALFNMKIKYQRNFTMEHSPIFSDEGMFGESVSSHNHKTVP